MHLSASPPMGELQRRTDDECLRLSACAVILEVTGMFFLKLSGGFAILRWGLLSVLSYILCFLFLAPAMKPIPVGVVYAIWAGVSIATATIVGIVASEDKLTAVHSAFIVMLAVGAVGLHATTHSCDHVNDATATLLVSHYFPGKGDHRQPQHAFGFAVPMFRNGGV